MADTLSRHDSIELVRERQDSAFVAETEEQKGPAKVQHAEPLDIDLIRDLDARRGEAEWNVGLGLSDRQRHDEVEMLGEYEFAPIDRLGSEIELPVTLYSGFPGERNVPRDRLESLKLAALRTFVADTARSPSVVLGYIHQFRLVALDSLTRTFPLAGNAFNPFAVIAKRLRTDWHTLVYAGAEFDRPRGARSPLRCGSGTRTCTTSSPVRATSSASR